MPHQCVHCGKMYEDGAEQVLKGCVCGSKFFFYLTKEKWDKIKSEKFDVELTQQEKKNIESEVREILGIYEWEETPIVLDFESIKVIKPGKYVIDLHNLFSKDKPLVYTIEDGKYFIDLSSQISNYIEKKKKDI